MVKGKYSAVPLYKKGVQQHSQHLIQEYAQGILYVLLFSIAYPILKDVAAVV